MFMKKIRGIWSLLKGCIWIFFDGIKHLSTTDECAFTISATFFTSNDVDWLRKTRENYKKVVMDAYLEIKKECDAQNQNTISR